MNNNYHTQLDKPSNMLNEIAASNKLLQGETAATQALLPQQQMQIMQNMQNFPGTPINKSQVNPQLLQQFNAQQQMLYAQQLAQQQAQQNQLYQQQLQSQTYPKAPQQIDTDEIELSEPKPEPKQIQQQPEPTQVPNPQNNLVQSDLPHKKIIQHRRPHAPHPKPQPPANKTNTTMEYIIIPIILLCVFVALVHPKTSGLLEKYLPKMDSMKGYLTRGLIFALIYIVIKFGTSMFASGQPVSQKA